MTEVIEDVRDRTTSKLDVVRKLLAQAEDPAVTAEEAEAYNAKARELIAAYGIDQAMLAAARPGTEEIITREISVLPAFAVGKTELLWAVASPLRVKGIRTLDYARYVRTDRRSYVMTLIGWRSDVDRAELLYTSLLLQAATEMARLDIPYFEKSAAYKQNWLNGFSDKIRIRLWKAEQRAERHAATDTTAGEPGPSVALVLADRSTAVDREVERLYPDVETAKARKLPSSHFGWYDGMNAAERADLGTTSVGASRRALA